jgi:hypothetical protein
VGKARWFSKYILGYCIGTKAIKMQIYHNIQYNSYFLGDDSGDCRWYRNTDYRPIWTWKSHTSHISIKW